MPYKWLAVLEMIGPGCVHIIQALVYCLPQHGCCKGFIDLSAFTVNHGQAHTAKAQCGYMQVQFSKFSVFH